MYPIINNLVAINGDTWAAPASTLTACWSALGAGANALSLSVFLTEDEQVVCTPENNLLASCGVDKEVHALSLNAIQDLDAGSTFRSRQLDTLGQPTGLTGEDCPWRAYKATFPLKDRTALFHPSLKQVFELFSRRTQVHLRLPEDTYPYMAKLLEQLLKLVQEFGLHHTVTFIAPLGALKTIRTRLPSAKLCLSLAKPPCAEDIDALVTLHSHTLLVRYENFEALADSDKKALLCYANQSNITWQFYSDSMPFAPTPEALRTLQILQETYESKIDAWHTQGALPCANACQPAYTVFSESFKGKQLNTNYWSAGYSHINQETLITVDDKLQIMIKEGDQYSGGAAICLLPIEGDFDAEVSFHVANPHQATTFELAAIGIDPGYHHMNNTDLDTRKVNLSFDVHGAPPYASSERDQNDAFRCGWNNSFNFAKFGEYDKPKEERPPGWKRKPEWEASSSNMYNKYGRGVGDGSPSNPNGQLRLTRKGALFNSYYRDAHNAEWVCSGTMLVQNLPSTCYLRLAAKHWHKIDPAPANVVQFWDFSFRQPV